MTTEIPLTTKLALWGQACGDAFGAAFEFHENAPAFAVQSIDEQRYLDATDDVGAQPKWARLPGLYTDDTQQALVLIHAFNNTATRGDAATMVRETFQEMAGFEIKGASFGVHRGTGGNFRTAVSTGKVPNTAGMGAAMRVGPVATMFEDPHLMVHWVLEVSQVTTSNPVALAMAAKYALMCWVMSHRDRGSEVQSILWPAEVVPEKVWKASVDVLRIVNQGDDREAALLDYAVKSGWSNKPMRCAANGFALTGVPWAIYWGMKGETFNDVMIGVCSSGGDTDTVAAMAGCLAALRFGEEDIPAWMRHKLLAPSNILKPHLWNPIGSEAPWTEQECEHRGEKMRGHYAAQRKRAAKRKAAEPPPIEEQQVDFMDMAMEDMEAELEAERVAALEPVLFGNRDTDPECYGPFSNFHQAKFVLDDEEWTDTEHCYMAQKNPDDAEYQAAVRAAPTAWKAKQLGKAVEIREGWDDMKYGIMLRAVYAKFSQNDHLRDLLLSTEDRPIHENRHDPWWGGGPNFPAGRDWLGHILMEVRSMLQDEE